MSPPILIALTANAGHFGHLNLIPARRPLPAGLSTEEVLGSAISAPVGRDYVAAVRSVPQAGTARTATEILVITGIAPGRPDLRDRLVQWLEGKLGQLGPAVQAIDWDRHTGGDYRCDFLDEWANEVSRRFDLKPPRRSSRTAWVVCVSAGLTVLGGTLLYQASRPCATPPPAPAPVEAVAWDGLRRAYPKGQEPDLDAIKAAVESASGHNFPSNFGELGGPAKQAQLFKDDAFRKWIVANYGPGAGRDFAPFFGELSDQSKRLLAEAGDLRSAATVLETRDKLRRRAAILADCRTLNVAPLNPAQRKSASFRLLQWVERSKAVPPPAAPGPAIPFVTENDVAIWGRLAEQDRALREAIEITLGDTSYGSYTPRELNSDRDEISKVVELGGDGSIDAMKRVIILLKDWPEIARRK